MRVILGILLLVTGCASLSEQKSDGPDLADIQTSAVNFKKADAKTVTGLVDYSFVGSVYKAQYIDCVTPGAKSTIIVSHSDRAGWDVEKFCDGWIAQSFLSQGFDVIAVNRPGYEKSTGKADFSGAHSLAAMNAGVKAALAAGKNPHQPTGVWGYSTGVTAAALLARQMGSLKFMILGGGVYDYDMTLEQTQDSYLKKDIQKIKDTGGDKAIEDRSIAYDVAGFPKVIMIYHGRLDTAVSPEQAKGFGDSLQSSAYQVSVQVLDGVNQNIPWAHHRKILEMLANSQLQ